MNMSAAVGLIGDFRQCLLRTLIYRVVTDSYAPAVDLACEMAG